MKSAYEEIHMHSFFISFLRNNKILYIWTVNENVRLFLSNCREKKKI